MDSKFSLKPSFSPSPRHTNNSRSPRTFIFPSQSRTKTFMHLQIHAIATPPLKPLECGSVKHCFSPPTTALLFRALKGREYLDFSQTHWKISKTLHKAFDSARKFYSKNATSTLVSLMAKYIFCKAAFMFLSIFFLQRFKTKTFFAKAMTEGKMRQEKNNNNLRNSLLITATQKHSLLTESNSGVVQKLLVVAASTEIKV